MLIVITSNKNTPALSALEDTGDCAGDPGGSIPGAFSSDGRSNVRLCIIAIIVIVNYFHPHLQTLCQI